MVTRTGDIPIAMCTELRALNWLQRKEHAQWLKKEETSVNLNFKWRVPLRHPDG